MVDDNKEFEFEFEDDVVVGAKEGLGLDGTDPKPLLPYDEEDAGRDVQGRCCRVCCPS